ncbi:unnamed protein product [Ceutorhynchus assimilis]|uniref:Uncharacterized protein n=1 Tax=Ceutorhynchus assimilis TaxID=467358 RepID=A0A9N9MSW1_9CUCU|nr:unnamed protein product [Ceutorhynchus assimilis]
MNEEHVSLQFENTEKSRMLGVKPNDNEFTSYCRACLNKTEKMIFLLENTETTNDIFTKFCNILNLEIELTSNYPSYFCEICHDKICIFFEFKQQCLSSNDLISRYPEILETERTEIKNEEVVLHPENHDNKKFNTQTKGEFNDNEDSDDSMSEKLTNELYSSSLQLQKLTLAQYNSEEVTRAINTVRDKLYKHTACIFCPFNGKSNKTLSIHVVKTHSEQKNHWCYSCNKLVDDLSVHNKNTHKEDLKCEFCDKVFGNISHFMEHMACHASSREHKCEICNLQCTSAANLKVHLGKHAIKQFARKAKARKSRLKQYSSDEINKAIQNVKTKLYKHTTCIFCSFNAGSNRSLSVHMTKSHSDQKKQWCYACNQLFDNLALHSQEVHSKDLMCQFCNKSIKGLSHFMDHMAGHRGSRDHQCQICNQLFASSRSLRVHVGKCGRNIQNNDGNVTLENGLQEAGPLNYCQKCNKKVRSLPQHNKSFHLKNSRHTAEKQQKGLCNYCGKKFETMSKLNAHVRIHTGETPYKCRYCDKKLRTRNFLVAHERTHTKEKPFICNICYKAFSQSSCLRTHSKIHTGKSEQCPMCEKRFCRAAELKLHMRTHTGEKPYRCDECDKSFVQSSHLMEHKRRHLDDRPFKCHDCQKAFKDLSTLKCHLQIHSGDKPFKCSQCMYACRQPYSLTQHMLQHEKDRPQVDNPHVCEICRRSFGTMAHLNAHYNRFHPNLKKTVGGPVMAFPVENIEFVYQTAEIPVVGNGNELVKFDAVMEFSEIQ